MTLTELRYVVTLARLRHFGKAAEHCHVSQPTLSVAIKKLENRIGSLLFERTTQDIRLTPSGERFVAQAIRVLDEAAQLEALAAAAQDPLHGPVRLGVIYTIAPYLLPGLIPALHRQAPLMPLYLQENFTHKLAESLRAGELDAIVVAAPFEEPGIVCRVLYEEPFHVLLPRQHPLAAETAIAMHQLDPAQLLLLGQGNCFRDQVVSACPQLATPAGLAQATEGSSLETVRYMVASGAGLSVIPASAAAVWQRQQDDLLVVRPFLPPIPSRQVVVAWRVSYPRPQAIEALCRAVWQVPPAGTGPLQ